MSEDIKESMPPDILGRYNEMVKKIKEYSNVSSTEVERISLGCVGVKRTTGQHPGGIVVVPDYKDVSDFTPFQFPADDPESAWRTTHFSYHAIDQCLLKLDILGHSDPTQLRMIQDLTKTDVSKVPMDDKETMSIFTTTKALGVTTEQILNPTGTLGIPEFGTNFTVSMVEDTKPKTFAELVKISGLSHGTDVWLGNAQELIKNKGVADKLFDFELTSQATIEEKQCASNFIFFICKNKDLLQKNPRIATIYNDSTYHYRIIIKYDDNASSKNYDNTTSFVEDDDFAFYYDWSKHTSNVNHGYNNSNIIVTVNSILQNHVSLYNILNDVNNQQ